MFDLGYIAAERLVLAAAFATALILWRRRVPVWAYVLLFGFSAALEYLLFVHGARLSFWGLQGDELFVTAFLERVAAGQPFSDFTYLNLPPFYPPFYFWFVGGVGYLARWNGVQAAKFGTAFSFALLPLASFFLQKRLFGKVAPDARPAEWGFALAAALFFPAVTWDAAVMKPYETITALLGVQVAVFFIVRAGEKLTRRSLFGYGLFFALLLGTYYFWGFQIAIAALLAFLFYRAGIWARLKNYLGVALIALAGSAVFWLPYLLSLRAGISPEQATFLYSGDFDLYLPFLRLDLFGVFFAFAVGALVYWRRDPIFRALGLLALAPYLWQIGGALVFIFGGRPAIPSKPFLFFGTAALVTAGAWGLARLPWRKFRAKWQAVFTFAVFAALATYSFAGLFIDQSAIRAARDKMQRPSAEIIELTDFFAANPNLLRRRYLSSGLPQLSAFVPLDLFLQPTVHFSHPAAGWKNRVAFLEKLAVVGGPEEFAALAARAPGGAVDGLLLYRSGDKYLLYMQEDAWPDGTREKTIAVPARLIGDGYWKLEQRIGNFYVFTKI